MRCPSPPLPPVTRATAPLSSMASSSCEQTARRRVLAFALDSLRRALAHSKPTALPDAQRGGAAAGAREKKLLDQGCGVPAGAARGGGALANAKAWRRKSCHATARSCYFCSGETGTPLLRWRGSGTTGTLGDVVAPLSCSGLARRCRKLDRGQHGRCSVSQNQGHHLLAKQRRLPVLLSVLRGGAL